MEIIKKNILIHLSALILIIPSIIHSQSGEGDYKAVFNSGDYTKTLEIINGRLREYYIKKVEDRRVPEQMLSVLNVGEKTDLVQLFRKRREKGFIIDDNPEMAELHFYAGKSLSAMNKKMDALNNYIQALRFSKFEDNKDDAVYYEISSIFKGMEGAVYFKGYIDSLEQAYIFNNNNYLYSLELGLALFSTEEKKKSLYHLERYLQLSGVQPEPSLYLKLASLNESIKKFMEAEKYYNEYLRSKPDDGVIHFALGYLCFFHTGNYLLAESSFTAALKYLREDDYYRRAKSLEYMGDISYSNLRYARGIELYLNGIKYQEMVQDMIKQKKTELKETEVKLAEMKSDFIYKEDFNNFEEYEMLQDDKGALEAEIDKLKYQLNSMNPGKIRWNIADIYNKTGRLQEAISYYREAIYFNYKANDARDMISKLQLKIRRGY